MYLGMIKMIMETKKISKKNMIGISLVVFSVFILFSISVAYNGNTIPNSVKTTSIAEPHPPSVSISEYGPKTSFEIAKTSSALGRASLPNYLPADFTLDSSRVVVDNERQSAMITAVYTSNGKKTVDYETFEDVINDGIVILYLKDNTYAADKWIKTAQDMVDRVPDARKIVTINGYTVLLEQGDPSRNISSQAHLITDGIHINLVSMNVDVNVLEKILSSIDLKT
ncbi:MAG: hypothetical protein ACREAK_08820 [Nitrosarchaeum sp.]